MFSYKTIIKVCLAPARATMLFFFAPVPFLMSSILLNSCCIRQNLHPVNGSHDSSAVPPKSYLLWHTQPGRLCRRSRRWSLVVSSPSWVSTLCIALCMCIIEHAEMSGESYISMCHTELLQRTVTPTDPHSKHQQRSAAAWCRVVQLAGGRGKPHSAVPTHTTTTMTSTSPRRLTGSHPM